MTSPVDGYNPNSVIYDISTSGHGGVNIEKSLGGGVDAQWIAALDAAAYAMGNSLALAWPQDNIYIDRTYHGAQSSSLPYPPEE